MVSPSPPPASFACLDPLFPDQWHHSYFAFDGCVVTHKGGREYHSGHRRRCAVPTSTSVSLLPTVTAGSFPRVPGSEARTMISRDTGRPQRCYLCRERQWSRGMWDRLGGDSGRVKLLQNSWRQLDYYFSDDLLVSTLTDFETHDVPCCQIVGGPTDDRRVEGPGILQSYSRIDAAIISFGRNGRKGKGGVVVFAAGNGGEYDNSNDDEIPSHSYVRRGSDRGRWSNDFPDPGRASMWSPRQTEVGGLW